MTGVDGVVRDHLVSLRRVPQVVKTAELRQFARGWTAQQRELPILLRYGWAPVLNAGYRQLLGAAIGGRQSLEGREPWRADALDVLLAEGL